MHFISIIIRSFFATFSLLCSMIAEEKINQAADRLWGASKSGIACAPVRDIIGADNIDIAYAAQKINIERRVLEGERIVGCKIGLTSVAVQKQLGVEQPDFGILTNLMQVEDHGSIAFEKLMQPKAEAEIAFILGQDIRTDQIDMHKLVSAIDHAVASIEIVGSRISNWDIRIADTIADNASASHFVLGKTIKKLEDIDLENCRMTLWRNDECVSVGEGKSCMGNPLNAALWLAQTMQGMGSPLRAGDVVLAGALGPMVPVTRGDRFLARIEGLGEVNVSFGQ